MERALAPSFLIEIPGTEPCPALSGQGVFLTCFLQTSSSGDPTGAVLSAGPAGVPGPEVTDRPQGASAALQPLSHHKTMALTVLKGP